MFYQVRDFVTSNRAARAHITATEVAAFMEEKNIISIKYEENGQHEKLDYNADLRAVRRYLARKQFKNRKVTGKVPFNSKNVSRRNDYVRKISENRAKLEYERLREVYTDESYVQHHHHQFKNNLYHPSTGFTEG